MPRDCYEVLGIGREAELSAIKKAYRRLAVANHPDKNPGDSAAEDRFKEASAAYAILSDPEKRRRYDQFGHAGLGAQGGFQGFDQESFADFGDILGDLFGFGSIFGGARGRRRGTGRAGADLRYDLEIDFDEAVHGLETRIQVPRFESCDGCEGRGAAEGGVTTCSECNGQGQVAFQQGFFTIARTCGACQGAGRQITEPCEDCNGQGRVRIERTLTAKIPAGVDEGMRLRMSGEGEAGTGGGPSGDLYVVLHVREHEVFQRSGSDILCDLPIPFSQAALGGEVDVPTLFGDQQMTIPAGTQSGTRFRMRGKGAPALDRSPSGDQYVTIRVHVPQSLNAEQRSLIEQLAEFEGTSTPDRGIFDRVKDIFSS